MGKIKNPELVNHRACGRTTTFAGVRQEDTGERITGADGKIRKVGVDRFVDMTIDWSQVSDETLAHFASIGLSYHNAITTSQYGRCKRPGMVGEVVGIVDYNGEQLERHEVTITNPATLIAAYADELEAAALARKDAAAKEVKDPMEAIRQRMDKIDPSGVNRDIAIAMIQDFAEKFGINFAQSATLLAQGAHTT